MMERVLSLVGSSTSLDDMDTLLFLIGAGLLYLGTLSTWMYFDSKRRGAAHPWEWALEPWIGGWLAPLIYLEERKQFGQAQDDDTEDESHSPRED